MTPTPDVLVVDHFDSFTFNLIQYLEELGARCAVTRIDALEEAPPDLKHVAGIVLSPGPCAPDPNGAAIGLLRRATCPVLGVCLGMQAICIARGGRLARTAPVHGKTSCVHHDGEAVYRHLPSPFRAARYHSLQIDEASLPPGLHVTARSEDGVPMGLRASDAPLEGIQFHPESVLSEYGHRLLNNWLEDL